MKWVKLIRESIDKRIFAETDEKTQKWLASQTIHFSRSSYTSTLCTQSELHACWNWFLIAIRSILLVLAIKSRSHEALFLAHTNKQINTLARVSSKNKFSTIQNSCIWFQNKTVSYLARFFIHFMVLNLPLVAATNK